jgi:sugar fermentation stimulation protein A
LNEGDLEKKKAAKHFIEIKNTTLMTEIDGQKHAQFPDAVTERGQKHLQELMNLIDDGHQAELIFTIQRTDVKFFSIAKEIDPKYFELFTKALKKGLIVTPVIVGINQSEIKVTDQVLKIK